MLLVLFNLSGTEQIPASVVSEQKKEQKKEQLAAIPYGTAAIPSLPTRGPDECSYPNTNMGEKCHAIFNPTLRIP